MARRYGKTTRDSLIISSGISWGATIPTRLADILQLDGRAFDLNDDELPGSRCVLLQEPSQIRGSFPEEGEDEIAVPVDLSLDGISECPASRNLEVDLLEAFL